MSTPKQKVIPLHDQNFHDLRAECLKKHELFEDPMFPAVCSSYYKKYDHMKPRVKLEWLRPGEICEKPVLFADGVSRFDASQGEVGNCWFIGSVSSFADFKEHSEELFHHVVPKDQGFKKKNYAGIFHFRFWQFGDWVEVVIDDRLPTRNGELISLSSSDKTEFWSALLEKAYAKLNGSYEALTAGDGSEALVDFSGAFAVITPLDPDVDIFPVLLKAFEEKALIGCGTKGNGGDDENEEEDDDDKTNDDENKINEDENKINEENAEGKEQENSEGGTNEEDSGEQNEGEGENEEEEENDDDEETGLVGDHYYSVTGIKTVPYSFLGEVGVAKMLRLRNPWGNDAEWNGPGSDESLEWNYIPQDVKDSMELKVEADGEFWIPYKNFVEKFENVEICWIPTNIKKKKDVMSVHGKWVGGQGADDISSNPQYVVNTTSKLKTTSIHIYLMEKNRRKRDPDSACQKLTLYVFEYSPEQPLSEVKDGAGFVRMKLDAEEAINSNTYNGREVQLTVKLAPKKQYVIVPVREKTDEDSQYLLRVVHDRALTLHNVRV